MRAPSATVVVTCYNLERYIGDAIRSVLDQTDVATPEIIVIDDCSADGSAAIIRTFPQVRYLRTPSNSGVLLATLQGIESAAHDIVFLMDGDDLWERTKLQRSLAAFAADPALALLTHDLTYIDAVGAPIPRVSRPAQELSPVPPERVEAAVRHGILSMSDYVWLGSALGLRRSTIDFDAFAVWARSLADPRHTYQDWPLAYWAAARTDIRLGYLDAKLFRYRLHGANHSGDARDAEKALRNWRRAANTSIAMRQLARDRGVAPRYRRIAEGHATLHVYLVSLYEGRRLAAVHGFLSSLPLLAAQPRRLAKEAVRLAMIGALGARRFTAWRQV